MPSESLNSYSDTQYGLFITQIGYSIDEVFAARVYYSAKASTLDNLKQMSDHPFIPVGSVQFSKEAMRLQGISCPSFTTYPDILIPYLKRRVSRTTIGVIRKTTKPVFIKPVEAKLFTGFVWPQDGEDKDIMLSLPDSTQIWSSDIVRFLAEWRYYICNDIIIGCGRYDDGDDLVPLPDINIVQNAVAEFAKNGSPKGYALDFGVLDSGETVLIEANDGWALGLYKGTCSPREYIRLLATRWAELQIQKASG